MSKRIAGKVFSTPAEAGVTPPTEEELARAEKIFHEFEQKVRAVAPEDRVTEVSPKFGTTFLVPSMINESKGAVDSSSLLIGLAPNYSLSFDAQTPSLRMVIPTT